MNEWTQRWNDRYSNKEFAYGEHPNDYLKEQLTKLEAGKALFPAEGEGRNAVFAAILGWEISAFDISIEGKNKALQLAEKNKVSIDYQVGELSLLNYQEDYFDVIALIYAHFPSNSKSLLHQTLGKYLKKGGIIIFEAFSKAHIDYISRDKNVGGPTDINMLFSVDEIKADFPGYEVIELEEKEIELKEGLYHNGKGSVIRFIGKKL